jgi:hypothetical protein
VAEWFIKNTDAEDAGDIGPLRPNELLDLVRAGVVRPETPIRKNDSAWFKAKEVGGLFEAAMRPTINYYCPKCDSPVPEPPSTCPKCLVDIERARRVIIENTIVSGDAGGKRSTTSRSMQNWLQKKIGKRK